MVPHLHKYNISKSTMHSALINRFELTGEQIDACEKYYILHWSGAHFRQVMSGGVVIHQGVSYLVVYKDCKPTEILPHSKLYLSFRKPAKEFGLQAYVLISISPMRL